MDYKALAQELRKALAGKDCKKVTKLLDDGFKGMYVVLRILRDNNTKILPSDIAKQMDVSTARIAVALKSLMKKGYIKRIPAESDGRKIVIEITSAGLDALSAREAVVESFIENVLHKLTYDEAVKFVEITKKLFK